MADCGPQPNGDKNEFEHATILEPLPNAMFRVRCDSGRVLTVHLSGTMRVQQARLVAGDRILIEPSPLDASKGRIKGRATH